MLILESSCIFRLGLCRHTHKNGGCDTVNTHSYLAFIGKWANCRVVRTEKVGNESVTVFL